MVFATIEDGNDTLSSIFGSFLFNAPTSTEIYTLSLHDALPISRPLAMARQAEQSTRQKRCCEKATVSRSEEHTSELQSQLQLVCRLLHEKKKVLSTVLLTQ